MFCKARAEIPFQREYKKEIIHYGLIYMVVIGDDSQGPEGEITLGGSPKRRELLTAKSALTKHIYERRRRTPCLLFTIYRHSGGGVRNKRGYGRRGKLGRAPEGGS